jgi:hypothetical protein
VIVECQQQLVTRLERVGFADQLQSVARVRREDDAVLVGYAIEEPQHPRAAGLDECGRADRRRVARMRIAKDPVDQSRGVRPDL